MACAAPIVVALYHTTTQRPRAVYYIVVLAAIFLVMNITKLAYHQARPFWVSFAIEAGSCSSQFGNPSGHSLTSLGVALAVWFDYNQAVVDGKLPSDSSFATPLARVLTLVAALAFGVSIGWSRFVLGAHSMNQIIFGLLLAVWLAASLHYGIYHLFMDQASKFVSGDAFEGERVRVFKNTVFSSILLFTVLMAVQIANCLIVEPTIVIDPEWAFEIEAKCGLGPLDSAFADKSFIQTGLISIGFGAYLGMVF